MASGWDSAAVAWDSQFVTWDSLPAQQTSAGPMRVNAAVWKKVGAEWVWVTNLDAYQALEYEPRETLPGPWTMTLPVTAQAQKLTKGRAITFDYRDTRYTGLVERVSAKLDERGVPVLEFGGSDALAILGDVLCWPSPESSLDAQEAHYQARGSAESVMWQLISRNMARRDDDVVMPSIVQNRGPSMGINLRFNNLLSVIVSLLPMSGLGIRLGLVNTSSTRARMTFEFYEPRDRSNAVRLSHKLGTLRTWNQSDTAPTVTAAIAAGGGQGANRIFRLQVDAAAQTAWGRQREVFIDARDTSDTDLLDQRAAEALLEGGPQSALEMEAADAEGMRYGTHFVLGDRVTVELASGVATAHRVGGVKITSDMSGVHVTIYPGNPETMDPNLGMAAMIRGISARVRHLEQES